MAFDYMKEHKSDNVGMHRGASENAAVSENTAAFKKLIASENLVVFEKSKLSESPPLSHPKNSSIENQHRIFFRVRIGIL